MSDRIPEELLAVAGAMLPGESLAAAVLARGGSHEVVLLPGIAAVRIASNSTALAALPRRTELLRRLADLDLPFTVPAPLSEVRTVEGRTAVVLSWVDGKPCPKGAGGEPKELASLLGSLRDVDCGPLAEVLGVPHEYAGGARWAEVMLQEVVPRLPNAWRPEGQRRIQAALDLHWEQSSLVHGDLAGSNMHWDDRGRLVGVLDWDLASAFDPGLDAACLSWHGWDKVRGAVDTHTLHRAFVWALTFGLEQVAFAILNNATEQEVAKVVVATTAWLERSAGWNLPVT
ncbi:aminoglycoside phosphotransferase family protein [Streptomyces sp. NPDC048442]|uniref:phosphotransferase family protein n=1 Tax=Streptomyces sp. NPDC048442 TaxID=3154823 RepID=UPI003428A505